MRVGYEIPESECKRLNSFLSLSATYINLLLNGSLQRFGTTSVRVLLFHLELALWLVLYHTKKKEKHTKFNYQHKDPPQLSLQRGET